MRARLFFVTALVAGTVLAQVPRRLVDLERAPAQRDSSPSAFVSVGETVYFFANDRYGMEVWASRGTPATTWRVTESAPGPRLGWVAPSGSPLLLQTGAWVDPNGVALPLWTVAGDGGLEQVTQPGWAAGHDAGPDGYEFHWVGRLGAVSVVNRCPRSMSQPCELLGVAGTRAFGLPNPPGFIDSAVSVDAGILLTAAAGTFRFDGTSYTPLAMPGYFYGSPVEGRGLATYLYYQGSTQRVQYWSTDGLDAGRLFDLPVASTGYAGVFAGKLGVLTSLAASDTLNSVNLANGAVRRLGRASYGLTDVVLAGDNRAFVSLALASGRVTPHAIAFDAGSGDGGAFFATPIMPSLSPSQFISTALGSRAFFYASDGLHPGLWVTDGAKTALVAPDVSAWNTRAGCSWCFELGAASTGSTLVLTSMGPAGAEPLFTDGTTAGTQVHDLTPGTKSSFPTGLVAMPSAVALWVASGDASVTLQTVDVFDAGVRTWFEGDAFAWGSVPVSLGERLVNSFDDGSHGLELWLVGEGGAELVDLEPGVAGSAPSNFARCGAALCFTAHTGKSGTELWRTDGTVAGTYQMKDLNPGQASSWPAGLVSLNSGVVFVASDGVHGVEPWVSDGTEGGTHPLADVLPGEASSRPARLLSSGVRAWFAAYDGQHGAELWTTDGTSSGTQLVSDLEPGPRGSNPVPWAARGTEVLFTVEPSTGGVVAVSDGTVTGTRTVLELERTWVRAAVATRSRWFFITQAEQTAVLWVVEGTSRARSVQTWSQPPDQETWLHALGDDVAFPASTPESGVELWQTSDGGAHLVYDLAPGRIDSWPGRPAQIGTRLVFAATDIDDDREPWVLQLDPSLDDTPPMVSVQVEGPRRNGWLVGTATWSTVVVDRDSPILEVKGCDQEDLQQEGTFTRECRARSHGGVTTRQLELKRDVTPPLITCPPDVSVVAPDTGVVELTYQVRVSDSVDPAPLLTVNPPSGSAFGAGLSTVRALAVDAAGHSAFCSFDVTVVSPATPQQTTPQSPDRVRAGRCGCTTGDGGLLLMALGLLLKARRRAERAAGPARS